MKMDTNKTHQEQNTILAKTVNQLKIELRKSNYEVLSLRNQLQSSIEQQANLFDSIEQFETGLDQVFANNSFSYASLSMSIHKITAQNPKRYKHLARSINVSNESVNRSASSIQSTEIASEKPHQSAQYPGHDDILNTAFFDDSDSISDDSLPMQSDESITTNSSMMMDKDVKEDRPLMKKPSRIPVPNARLKNQRRSVNDLFRSRTVVRQKRSIKKIDYREQPINRKMRRFN